MATGCVRRSGNWHRLTHRPRVGLWTVTFYGICRANIRFDLLILTLACAEVGEESQDIQVPEVVCFTAKSVDVTIYFTCCEFISDVDHGGHILPFSQNIIVAMDSSSRKREQRIAFLYGATQNIQRAINNNYAVATSLGRKRAIFNPLFWLRWTSSKRATKDCVSVFVGMSTIHDTTDDE